MNWTNFFIFAPLLCGIAYQIGLLLGERRGRKAAQRSAYQRGYDTGWCDQQIEAAKRAEQRNRERRDRHGRFINRAAIRQAKQLNPTATGDKTP